MLGIRIGGKWRMFVICRFPGLRVVCKFFVSDRDWLTEEQL